MVVVPEVGAIAAPKKVLFVHCECEYIPQNNKNTVETKYDLHLQSNN